jgi:hypothetical protein
VAVVTFLLSDEVIVVLASCRCAVMTARTRADHVKVVNAKSWFPKRCAMTVFAKIGCIHMID